VSWRIARRAGSSISLFEAPLQTIQALNGAKKKLKTKIKESPNYHAHILEPWIWLHGSKRTKLTKNSSHLDDFQYGAQKFTCDLENPANQRDPVALVRKHIVAPRRAGFGTDSANHGAPNSRSSAIPLPSSLRSKDKRLAARHPEPNRCSCDSASAKRPSTLDLGATAIPITTGTICIENGVDCATFSAAADCAGGSFCEACFPKQRYQGHGFPHVYPALCVSTTRTS
jgi:hypothetical protein